MTDSESLFRYRMDQAEATLRDAETMFEAGTTPRSIVNRCYYAMFYATLALFLKMRVAAKTSKHSGVIGVFDKEFIASGKIEKDYSRMLHSLFDSRQEFDYKEFSEVSPGEATIGLQNAHKFVDRIKSYVAGAES